MQSPFSVVIKHDGDWFVAYCPEIPGANGQGKTKEEAVNSLNEAALLILEDRRIDAAKNTLKLIPIKTPRINPGNDLTKILSEASEIPASASASPFAIRASGDKSAGWQKNDIIVISSKAVATSESRMVDLNSLTPSDEAKKYSEECGRTPLFCQAVLEEMKKRNGEVRGTCPGAIITELRPWTLSRVILSGASSERSGERAKSKGDTAMGTILTANAGLDESNAPEGKAVGWPEDPVLSARRLRMELEKQKKLLVFSCSFLVPKKILKIVRQLKTNNQKLITKQLKLAIIITDSCTRPRRWGVTAYALAVSGIDPLQDEAGKSDLFGRKLLITKEAIADQLATAANMLMGNADQCTPAVIIRDHGIELSEFEGWVPGIEPEEDLFKCL